MFKRNAEEIFDTKPGIFRSIRMQGSDEVLIVKWEDLEDLANDSDMFNRFIGNIILKEYVDREEKDYSFTTKVGCRS